MEVASGRLCLPALKLLAELSHVNLTPFKAAYYKVCSKRLWKRTSCFLESYLY